MAASACTAGKVRIDGQIIKPARSARPGEIITAVVSEITRTIKVLALIERRVSAPLAAQCYEDLTPPSEYEKPREPKFLPLFVRPRGTGRPTKKDRRRLDGLLK